MKHNTKIWFKIKLFCAIIGPGLVVMLADTDASSIITAAQTGAVWAYKMLLLQIILIPILYITQELTVRLGIGTKMGYGELIKQKFGKFWAWIAILALFITCIGAIIGQFVGIAGVGLLFGIPSWSTISLAIVFLMFVVLTGSYRSVERCAIIIGLFELVFVIVAWLAHPSIKEIIHGLGYFPIHNSKYLYLAAANIGAVIMPWMIFYQQSAVVDKGITSEHVKMSRLDTAIGAVITQAIMIAVIITIAATIGKTHPGMPLRNVHQISDAITPFLGTTVGHLCFALGMLGASLVAAIVVSLTVAWSIGEITGFKHSIEHKPREAPWFYLAYGATLILGFILIESGINLVELSVAVNVVNALLLPLILLFLYLLATKTLPEKLRLKGKYSILVGFLFLATAAFSFYAGLRGIIF